MVFNCYQKKLVSVKTAQGAWGPNGALICDPG